MKQVSKIPLIIALAVPVLMILLVAGSIYIPALFAQAPTHNFFYADNDNNDYRYSFACEGETYTYQPVFRVENQRVVKVDDTTIPESCKNNIVKNPTAPRLFFYDVKNNKSKEMTIEQAQAFIIDSRKVSPDGFTIQRGNRNDGVFPLLFGGSYDYNAWYITKDSYSKKLTLSRTDTYYYDDIGFLGWVE